jgi:hypothetical protein
VEDVVDLPLSGEVKAVDARADYVSYPEWSEAFRSEFGVWVREAKVSSF